MVTFKFLYPIQGEEAFTATLLSASNQRDIGSLAKRYEHNRSDSRQGSRSLHHCNSLPASIKQLRLKQLLIVHSESMPPVAEPFV